MPKVTTQATIEQVFITNLVQNDYPILLRTWPCKGSDSFEQFSMPFLGRNNHPELGIVTVLKEITGTKQAQQLLNW